MHRQSLPAWPSLKALVLREFPSCSLALVGCRGDGTSYPCCEYDVILAGDSPRRFSRLGADGMFVDVHYIGAGAPDRMRTETFYPFLSATIITDGAFLISQILDRARTLGSETISAGFSSMKMISAKSKIQKSREAESRGELVDAAFWLLSSSYELAESIVSSGKELVHPSHLLDSLRRELRGIEGLNGDLLYQSLGLAEATKTALRRRVEAMDKLLLSTLEVQDGTPESIYLGVKLLKSRAGWMADAHMVSQAYSYLGYEFVRNVEMIYSRYCTSNGIPPHHTRILSEITERSEKPYRIASSMVKMVSLGHEQATIRMNIKNLSAAMELLTERQYQPRIDINARIR